MFSKTNPKKVKKKNSLTLVLKPWSFYIQMYFMRLLQKCSRAAATGRRPVEGRRQGGCLLLETNGKTL